MKICKNTIIITIALWLTKMNKQQKSCFECRRAQSWQTSTKWPAVDFTGSLKWLPRLHDAVRQIIWVQSLLLKERAKQQIVVYRQNPLSDHGNLIPAKQLTQCRGQKVHCITSARNAQSSPRLTDSGTRNSFGYLFWRFVFHGNGKKAQIME